MKKYFWSFIYFRKQHFLKLLTIMKLSLLLLCFALINVSAISYPQKITCRANNLVLSDLLSLIEKQSPYKFLYEDRLVQTDSKLSIDVKDKLITEVLDQLLQNEGLYYTIFEDNLVVITKSNKIKNQTITIKGKVTDVSSNEPVPGVNVIVEGTSIGAVTDLDGNYQIDVPDQNAVLIFSFVGYLSQKIAVDNNSVIDVVLSPDVTQLEEVVVIGYGTQKKADVTSAVSSVKAVNFIQGNVLDAGQLIQGKVSGLAISTPSGDPTSNTQILLRGRTTLLGANQNPLILVDGVPGDLNTVAPQDIESIDVLKDGSAAAIYGTRGTNGVIFITTRRASGMNKNTVEYSTYFSTQTLSRKPDISTADQYREQIAEGYRVESQDLGSSTDWLKEISQTPLSQLHNLTIRGGNENTNYLLNANYNYAEGVFKKSDNETFTGRADFNHSMFDGRVKINVNLLNSSNKYTTTGDGYSFNGYVYREALIQNPTSPIKDENGNWYQQTSLFEYENPLSRLYESSGRNNAQNSRFKGSIEYSPIKDIKLTGVFAYTKWDQNRGYAETKKHISTLRDGRNGYASVGSSQRIDKLVELTAEYTKTISDHKFMILGGYSYQDDEYEDLWMQNWDFPTDVYGFSNIGAGNALKDGLAPEYSYRALTNLIGFFGRVTYNFKEKYLMMASLRYEAASQLWGTENPWGTFPAISVGWRITNESFMKNQNLFNDIKLRAGYGVTGTQPSDLFLGVGLIGYSRYVYSNGKWLQTLIPTQNPNPDLRWEEKHESNFGLDFSMLDNRVGGSIDYYIRKIKGLLFDYAVPSPPNLYSSTRANVGTMENKGIEVMLNFKPVIANNFDWTANVSFSTNTNKLESLSNDLYQASSDYFTTGYTGPPVQTFTHIVKVGEPIGNFYGFKVIDIGDDPNDVANYGQWVYEGSDGNPVNYIDFTHSFSDKKVIGNGLPKYYLGLNNNFQYKNWDLSITQRGAFKFQIANFQRMMYENPTFTQYNLLNSAFDKVYGKALLKSPQEFNSYYIENGDYWKIDNITLGFNIPNPRIKYIRSIRIYVSTLNTFTITGYSGIDPEVVLLNPGVSAQSGININNAPGLSPGIDNRDKYPTTRTYTIGLNVNF
jgi:TonB-linked SusC/RagA family outer membrane protein